MENRSFYHRVRKLSFLHERSSFSLFLRTTTIKRSSFFEEKSAPPEILASLWLFVRGKGDHGPTEFMSAPGLTRAKILSWNMGPVKVITMVAINKADARQRNSLCCNLIFTIL